MHEHVTTFGDLLRRLRSAAALSQEALAERAGLSRSGISDLERGARQVPRLETVRTLADALALSDADRTALLATARPALLGVDASEPPPSTLIALPVPLTRLIGRETEVMTLRAALQDADTRLLTLTGPGGVGKTRLAIAIAAGLPDAFPDGVVFVDLAPLTDSALMILTVAAAFGVREITGQPLIETLSALLAPKQVLLVLDNCEHVLAETADLVGRLLSRCPQLHILATSRAPLHMRGEQVQPVEPLPLAADGVTSFEQLAQNASVSLFVERAQAVRPAFQLDHANAPTVAAICRHLDGLTLAIELAAARTTMFTPEALLAQMSDRLRLLRGGARDAPARQQTMRATIAWSHDLLSVEQQALFRRLAGFAGGFTADAAEAVAGACGDREEEAEDVLMTLGTLIDASLVQTQAVPDEPRFAMFETIREYALEQLLASGEEEAVRESHASWFLSLAESSAPQPTAFARMDQLMAEHENLRAALHWFAARRHAESLLRLTGALTWFWYFGG
jgi:predicted ATPase/DNA-binding XRE family transcriptional regulator